MEKLSLADRYKSIRGSKAFLWGLTAFIASWLIVHHLTGLDPDLSNINLILSAEASLSVAVFINSQDKSDRLMRELTERILKAVVHTEEVVEDIEEELA